ncbi:MAG: ADP-ribosylation factor-like protein [Promethearchaeota archaeon]
MLRQAFILKGNEIIYKRIYGNALSNSEIEDLSFKIISEAKRTLGRTTGYFDFIKYRVSYDVDLNSMLSYIFITGLMDDFYRTIKLQLSNFKKLFLDRFGDNLKDDNLKMLNFVGINIALDEIHRNLKPKIAVVGFAGVGKTTIKQLIKMDEIPLQHVPTITGEIATIKIGKLFFRLFDFAGQEQFKFLWKGFIKESDAVLIVTDSTQKNIEKSKFFLDLKLKEVPHARAAIIGNKQDLPNALSIAEIERITGLKTYPMVANRKENRNKMIRIIADILDMSTEDSSLLSELFENTDLSYETLFGLNDESVKDEFLVIPQEPVLLEALQVEQKFEVNEIKNKIDQIISKSSEDELGYLAGNKKYHQSLKMPIEDALITSELFNEIEKNKSFGYYDKLSILFTALNCVFLTKMEPKKYPKFSVFFKDYKMHIFNSKEINLVRKYYSKILKQVTA